MFKLVGRVEEIDKLGLVIIPIEESCTKELLMHGITVAPIESECTCAIASFGVVTEYFLGMEICF